MMGLGTPHCPAAALVVSTSGRYLSTKSPQRHFQCDTTLDPSSPLRRRRRQLCRTPSNATTHTYAYNGHCVGCHCGLPLTLQPLANTAPPNTASPGPWLTSMDSVATASTMRQIAPRGLCSQTSRFGPSSLLSSQMRFMPRRLRSNSQQRCRRCSAFRMYRTNRSARHRNHLAADCRPVPDRADHRSFSHSDHDRKQQQQVHQGCEFGRQPLKLRRLTLSRRVGGCRSRRHRRCHRY